MRPASQTLIRSPNWWLGEGAKAKRKIDICFTVTDEESKDIPRGFEIFSKKDIIKYGSFLRRREQVRGSEFVRRLSHKGSHSD